MTLRIGDTAPDFTQDSSLGELRFHDWLGGSWGVLFSHPADFTPVCTTELGLVARNAHRFAARNVKVLALSVDTAAAHREWIQDINETQDVTVDFPILADADHRVSRLYDLIHPRANATATVRSVFVIDPARAIRLIITYPASTGRNIDEILRAIDSLQLTDAHPIATPGNWKDGDEVVILPTLQDETALSASFPRGHRPVRSWLRYTPQPNRDALAWQAYLG